MKKLLAGLCMALSLTACGDKKEAEKINTKPVIKIGATLPLTGNLAYYGKALQQSLNLALEDANRNNLKYDYQLVIEDDKYDLKQAVVNLNRMKSINDINAVMSFWGNIGTLVSDWADKNAVIHMGCAASDKVGIGYYNFNHATQPQSLLNRILKYYRDNNFKRIGIAYLQALEIQEFVDNFVPILEENGFEVVFVTSFNPQERDLKMEILKMKEANPDVVEVLMNSPIINIFGKTSKELGFNVPMSSINNMTDALEEYEGQTFVTEDSGKASFTEHFESKTGTPQTACVVNFYDGLNMLINAYEKTAVREGQKIPTNEDVAKTLLDIEHNGFVSVINEINMDDEGNIDSPAVLKRIINGKPTTVEK
ncbi:MAG: ABC transporter substrate-binding protein [Alphaproteobacteria bacterium]|nr:ABC transporter substrate-binding protein [Alphaproteobacteria bacterium]